MLQPGSCRPPCLELSVDVRRGRVEVLGKGRAKPSLLAKLGALIPIAAKLRADKIKNKLMPRERVEREE